MSNAENIIPFSLKNLTQEQRERLAELVMEIRSDIQYLILIIADHPNAKVVKEVRAILAQTNGNKVTENQP